MKILLTGASGLVGSNVAKAASRRGHEVLGIASSWSEDIPGVNHLHRLDLQDENETTALILAYFPDAIVNAAAISDPSACEKDPVLSRAINVTLPEILARMSHHLGARLIHLSSEQVFDGKNTPYFPTDPVCPINLYGQQKVVSEQQVESFAPETTTIIRLPLLTGNSLTGLHSLHEKLFAQWAIGKKTPLFADEFRQPCSAENVSEVIVELCERVDLKGKFHWAGAETLSRLEVGTQILKHFKLPETLIEESSQKTVTETTPRQPDLSLKCEALTQKLKTQPQTLSEQLELLNVPKPFQAWYHSI